VSGWRDQYDAKIEDMIRDHGWAIQGVGGDTEQVQFSYTIGLHRRDLPEFIAFGLPMQAAQVILNQLAQQQVDADGFNVIQHGTTRHDVLVNYPAKFVRVLDSTEHLTMANRLARQHAFRTPVDALQLCWPDKDGRFQWEPGFSISYPVPLLGPQP
jgi:hypothetical protein